MRFTYRTISVALATAGLAAAATVSAATATAAPYQPPVVQWVGDVVQAPVGTHTAIVRAQYRCFGGEPTHLYIGLKQGPRVNDTTHTTSDYARAFYSTNYNADGPSLSLNCDGQSHKRAFTLRPQPGFEQKAPLRDGPAFVQFCIFDSTNSGAEGDENGFAFDYSMKTVQRIWV